MILLLESKMVRVWSGKGSSPKYERDVGQPYHHFENDTVIIYFISHRTVVEVLAYRRSSTGTTRTKYFFDSILITSD